MIHIGNDFPLHSPRQQPHSSKHAGREIQCGEPCAYPLPCLPQFCLNTDSPRHQMLAVEGHVSHCGVLHQSDFRASVFAHMWPWGPLWPGQPFSPHLLANQKSKCTGQHWGAKGRPGTSEKDWSRWKQRVCAPTAALCR